MTPAPPIKRHEVFLIIALLFLNCCYAVKEDWLATVHAVIAVCWFTASLAAFSEDKT